MNAVLSSNKLVCNSAHCCVNDSSFYMYAARCKQAPPAVHQERFVASRILSLSRPARGRQLLDTEHIRHSMHRCEHRCQDWEAEI